MSEETLGRRLGKMVNEAAAARVSKEQERIRQAEDYDHKAGEVFSSVVNGLEALLSEVASREETEVSVLSEFGLHEKVFKIACEKLAVLCNDQDLKFKIESRMADDGCLYDNFVVDWREEVQKDVWRKDAKVWAEGLKKTQPANDKPPGFEPDDDNSYPIVIERN